MAQAPANITAAQVLEAGRLAEAEGRLDYAVQFFRHLTEHHASSPEAMMARQALARLAPRSAERPQAPALHRPSPLNGSAISGNGSSARLHAVEERRPGISIAPLDAAAIGIPLELPPPVRGYVPGRVVAQALTATGLVAAGFGIVLIALNLLAAEAALAGLGLSAVALNILVGPGLLGCGLLVAFSGQFASAVFEIANSTRELVAIERAKAAHFGGEFG
jgi:hypothetical protein